MKIAIHAEIEVAIAVEVEIGKAIYTVIEVHIQA